MKAININDVTRTYRGKNECACGCGGTYSEPGSRAEKMRVDFINKNLDKAQVINLSDEDCYEVENRDGSRVTRVYVKVGA